MEEIPSNARSWNLTTSEVHRISGSMLFKVCELFHYVSGVKFQSRCYSTALFRRSFLSFKMLWWSLWFRRICFIWNWQLHDRHPLNWPKQSQLLDYLSPTYMFARSVFEKEEQKVLIVRCLVLCAVRIFYRFLGWYGGFHDHRTQSEINYT